MELFLHLPLSLQDLLLLLLFLLLLLCLSQFVFLTFYGALKQPDAGRQLRRLLLIHRGRPRA